MQPLQQFVTNLLTERGVTHVDPAVMDEYRADLLMRISERLNAEMVALLTPEKIDELNELLDAEAEPEAVNEFFRQNVAAFDEVFAQTLADFRTSYLS
jgi:predicted dinucleotide-binding enzyme